LVSGDTKVRSSSRRPRCRKSGMPNFIFAFHDQALPLGVSSEVPQLPRRVIRCHLGSGNVFAGGHSGRLGPNARRSSPIRISPNPAADAPLIIDGLSPAKQSLPDRIRTRARALRRPLRRGRDPDGPIFAMSPAVGRDGREGPDVLPGPSLGGSRVRHGTRPVRGVPHPREGMPARHHSPGALTTNAHNLGRSGPGSIGRWCWSIFKVWVGSSVICFPPLTGRDARPRRP